MGQTIRELSIVGTCSEGITVGRAACSRYEEHWTAQAAIS